MSRTRFIDVQFLGDYLVDKQKTIYVEDAETAVKIIAQARDDAKIRLQVIER